MQPTATTVEMDGSHFDDLKDAILRKKEEVPAIKTQDKTEKQQARSKESTERKEAPVGKHYTFMKGGKSFNIDEDAEIEFMADKKPMKLTLRELKDRAAGDVAVKNRMHSLAEEKKRVQSTFKEFATIAREDPLAALEYISKQAKEADSDFEYNKYLEKLADQAEKLGQMDEKERKALELQKKLSKAEQDLSLNERKTQAVLRKQELLSQYPEIGDSQFGSMVDAVLNNEELLEGVTDERGVLDKVEELIQETLTQRDIMSVIEEVNPAYVNDNNLIFSLSDQLRQNPDLDEEDIREIIREIIPSKQRKPIREAPRDPERERATKTLSQKARQGVPVEHLKAQGGSDYDVLQAQLLEHKKEFSKTPKYMR